MRRPGRPLLHQIDALEAALAAEPLGARMARARATGLSICGFSDDLAAAFHDINAQWITAMFALEDTDREVLEPRASIIEPGGDSLFVHADGVGIVGVCALQKTGDRAFELTKMGILESARGRKATEVLLRAFRKQAVLFYKKEPAGSRRRLLLQKRASQNQAAP